MALNALEQLQRGFRQAAGVDRKDIDLRCVLENQLGQHQRLRTQAGGIHDAAVVKDRALQQLYGGPGFLSQGAVQVSRNGHLIHGSHCPRKEHNIVDMSIEAPRAQWATGGPGVDHGEFRRVKRTQIVVVGGGAAGLELVTRLGAKYGREKCQITLVEKYRTHIWKPLLHEVAAGSLDDNLDEVGYRSHCHRWGYHFFQGTLEAIDRAGREMVVPPLIDLDGRELMGRHRIAYDYLVVAIGSVTNDFGTPGASSHCLFLDSRVDADDFRDRLLNQCLRVSRAVGENPAADAQVRVAIVGGGATGVALAAELFNAAFGPHDAR